MDGIGQMPCSQGQTCGGWPSPLRKRGGRCHGLSCSSCSAFSYLRVPLPFWHPFSFVGGHSERRSVPALAFECGPIACTFLQRFWKALRFYSVRIPQLLGEYDCGPEK